jgi:hypothetical protein
MEYRVIVLACVRPMLADIGFIVRGAIFPAAKQNPNPLEGQRPHGSLMAFVLALSLVVLPRPGGKGK